MIDQDDPHGAAQQTPETMTPKVIKLIREELKEPEPSQTIQPDRGVAVSVPTDRDPTDRVSADRDSADYVPADPNQATLQGIQQIFQQQHEQLAQQQHEQLQQLAQQQHEQLIELKEELREMRLKFNEDRSTCCTLF